MNCRYEEIYLGFYLFTTQHSVSFFITVIRQMGFSIRALLLTTCFCGFFLTFTFILEKIHFLHTMLCSCTVQGSTHQESQLVLLTMVHEKWLLGGPARHSLQDSPNFPLVICTSYLREVTVVDTFITEFSSLIVPSGVLEAWDKWETNARGSWLIPELNECISQLASYVIQKCRGTGWSLWADTISLKTQRALGATGACANLIT